MVHLVILQAGWGLLARGVPTRTGALPPKLSSWRPLHSSTSVCCGFQSQHFLVSQAEIEFIKRLINYMAKGSKGKKKKHENVHLKLIAAQTLAN